MPEANEKPKLAVLLETLEGLKKEYGKRKKEFDTQNVLPNNEQPLIDDGWEFDTKLKRRVRYKKRKPIDERLENRCWSLLYSMGFPVMNEGRSFQIRYKQKGVGDASKQIDVFAKDDETVVVAECKASEVPRRRSLQKDIGEFSNLKGKLAASIKDYFGEGFKPKIIWLFVTENIEWSKPDRDRAEDANIKIITEREFRYINELTSHLKHAAKYQFLAEYIGKNQEIPGLSNVIVPATTGRLYGRIFYSFVTTPRQLLKISFVNHRALNDPLGAPTYQRLIKKQRLNKIKNFIDDGGYFPTNLLINFKTSVIFDLIKADKNTGTQYGLLHLPSKFKSVWIIDGQHRLYGYSHAEEAHLDDNIIVIAFQNLPSEEEASLFVTINKEQQSVSSGLLEDLEGELKWGSDVPSERIGAIGARVVQLLNTDLGQPLYGRFTVPGIRATETACITVKELKDGLRQPGLTGTATHKRKVYTPGPLSGINDKETLDRTCDVLNAYFGIIKDANTQRWNAGRSGFICSNPGIRGHLRLLAELIKDMEAKTAQSAVDLSVSDLIEQIQPKLAPVIEYIHNTDNQTFLKDFKVTPGSGGAPEYYYSLCLIVNEKFPDFEPIGYSDWLMAESEENTTAADKRVKAIVDMVQGYIFHIFREKYGEDITQYWEMGVIEKDIMRSAYDKFIDDPAESRLVIEAYLGVTELKKIVEKKVNWKLFRDVFNIETVDSKGHAKHLKWMDTLNEIRRIPAHSYKRKYKPEDFIFLETIETELTENLEDAGYIAEN